MRLEEWQLWMHPYPTLIKTKGRRLNPAMHRMGRLYNDNKGFVRLSDIFEERKQTPPQLKRCVRAVVKRELKGDSSDQGKVRAALSKGFAVCTAQLQKHGFLRLKSQVPTKKGKTSGKSKAAQKGHSDKVSDYERMLAKARG